MCDVFGLDHQMELQKMCCDEAMFLALANSVSLTLFFNPVLDRRSAMCTRLCRQF
jgi:hypothetical protein